MKAPRHILQSLLNKPSWTPEEREWLLNYLQQQDTPELRSLMLEQYVTDIEDNNELPAGLSEKLLHQIQLQIEMANDDKKSVAIINWKHIAAAAAVIIMIISGSYFLLKKDTTPELVAKKEIQGTDVAAPNTSNAVITLANGQQIILDSAGNGTLATQGNVTVTKTADGQIVYNGIADEIMINMLSNPRGSKAISLTLVDGSKVWLNAESSLRYPTAFTGNERKVEITGEAYFEVVKNAEKPFIVNIAGKENVEVLGTSFNINSYEDEQAIKVTLIEGSVKVVIPSFASRAAGTSLIIKPGQQALYQPEIEASELKLKSNIDVGAVLAWKNGFFNFDNADLKTVLRQLSRWYDVDVIFEGNVPKRNFGGEMQRDLTLSEVLKLLEKNNVHFRIEGKKLLVTP